MSFWFELVRCMGLNEANMTYGRWIWRCSKRKTCRHQQAGKTTNTVSLCGLRHVLELNPLSGFFPPHPIIAAPFGRSFWPLASTAEGWVVENWRLIDTWFGRKLWLDVHKSMFVFKFQHGHPYQTRTLFYTGTHVPLPMHPRNVNYIYLFFLPQICQYIYIYTIHWAKQPDMHNTYGPIHV